MNRQEKIEKIKDGKYFAKGDIAVFAVCLLLVAVFTLFSFGAKEKKGSFFEVISFGETIAQLPLGEDASYLYTVSGEKGRLARVFFKSDYEGYKNGNLIVVENKKVRVEEADCPDKTCVLTGASDSREIICMPHGLTIRITGGGLGGDA